MTAGAFRKLALSMPAAHEEPHMERTSFRVKKKIFATMVKDGSEAMVKVKPLSKLRPLLTAHPDVFFDYGGWTWKLGCLGIHLKKADAKLLEPLVLAAWRSIAPKRPPKA